MLSAVRSRVPVDTPFLRGRWRTTVGRAFVSACLARRVNVSIDTFDRGLTQRRAVVRVEWLIGAGAAHRS